MDAIFQILAGGLTSIIGVIVGYLLPAIDTRRKKDRLRAALYKEIIAMYDGLDVIIAFMGETKRIDKDKTGLMQHMFSIVFWLQDALLKDESYKHAKSDPTLFYGLKEATAIEDAYKKYDTIRSNALTAALERIPVENQLDALKGMCKDARERVERHLQTGGFDKELLLKVSDPSIREKMTEIIQFKPIKKRWYAFWEK